MTTAELLKTKIEKLPAVTSRPMFGYQCYMTEGKFFAGFGGNNAKLIVRLPQELQVRAIRSMAKARPFSHGARRGWIEINLVDIDDTQEAFRWIKRGFDYACVLSRGLERAMSSKSA